jgi:regulatory protein
MAKKSETVAIRFLESCCSKAEHCVFDVRRMMSKWGLDEKAQSKIIHGLIKNRFIDESRYCKAFVNDKIKFNNWGQIKIIHELRKRQIPEDLIEEALSVYNSEESVEKLSLMLNRKRKSIKTDDEYIIRHKLVEYGRSRGFSCTEIKKAMNL